MDEMILNGKNHVSSKRAAEITGYAKDYIGQLCREGRIEARLVGRSWYVDEESLRRHRFGTEGIVQSEVEVEEQAVEEEVTQPAQEPQTLDESEALERIEEGDAPVAPETPDGEEETEALWHPAVYTSEEVTVLPEMKSDVNTNHVVSEEKDSTVTTEEVVRANESVVEKEETSPVHIIRKTNAPILPRMKTIYDIQPAAPIAKAKESLPKAKKAVSKKTFSAYKIPGVFKSPSVVNALLIAFALFALVFSSIVSGLYTQDSGPLAPLFQYLGGTSTINN